jgi:putative ABC transport system permease protein
MRRLWRLGLRMLGRDARAGELRLLIVALVIAVAAVTSVALFADRLQRGLALQSAELLGADLVLLAPDPVASDWIEAARRHGLRTGGLVEFTSVVLHGERLQLASVRAVEAPYPLRGTLRTAPQPAAADTATEDVPAPGTVWVEARLLHQLGIAPGARVTVGRAGFTVARVLTHEPGRGGNVFGMAPRVLMARADVAATGVVQPGSRVSYIQGFAGAAPDVTALRVALQPQLGEHHVFLDPRGGNAAVARALDRVEQYLGLTSLLAVLLAGAAMALAARRYAVRHYDTSALLRCIGATQNDLAWLVLPPLAVLGVLAGLAGAAVGWLAQEVIHLLLRGLFPAPLPSPGLEPVALGIGSGLITLAGFAVPPLWQLRRVPPLRVLRRDLLPLPPGALALYGSALAALALLAGYHSGSARVTGIVLGGLLVAGSLLTLLAAAILAGLRVLFPHGGAAWRYGMASLWRRARSTLGQVLAFGFVLMAMTLIALVRTDLLLAWERQLPADTPNHFVYNVLSHEVGPLERFFAGHGVAAQALYPMVRGRLVEIDGVPVTQAVTKEDARTDDPALQRELHLTWSAALPPDNTLARGQWWDGAGGVSVESRLARRLGIELGMHLTFSVGGARVTATVASLRTVQWDSFHPNFYMIFEPGALDGLPVTYLTSFHLTPAQRPVLASLVRAFPSASLLDTEPLLAQVRRLLAQVTLALEFVLLFVLAAGLAVLAAAVAASLDERRQEGAVLRALGASRAQLRAGQLAEFALLGLAAGLLAALGTELIAGVLYAQVFDLPYHFKWPVWLLAPVAGASLVAGAGLLGTRRVRTTSPLSVLRSL